MRFSTAASASGLRAIRGDEKHVDGQILGQILEGIVSSSIVIALLDGRNPNVYFELGIAQALGKRTIMLSSDIESAPFDVKASRALAFTDTDDLRRSLPEFFARVLATQAPSAPTSRTDGELIEQIGDWVASRLSDPGVVCQFRGDEVVVDTDQTLDNRIADSLGYRGEKLFGVPIRFLNRRVTVDYNYDEEPF